MEIATKGMRVELSTVHWRKSTYSGPHCDNCVEVAFLDGGVAVRDSKDPSGPALVFTGPEWDAFVAGVRDGQFDS